VEHVRDTPRYVVDDLQRPPASAELTKGGKVADLIADHRLGIIVERRYKDAADLTRRAWGAGIVNDLDQRGFLIDVVVRTRGALVRHQQAFLGTVGRDGSRATKGPRNVVTLIGPHTGAEGQHRIQLQLDPEAHGL
jgi:hypothetical protein